MAIGTMAGTWSGVWGQRILRHRRAAVAGVMAMAVAGAMAGPMAGEVRATTLYWDINGAAADTGSLTGNWDGLTANFNTDSTGGAGGTTTAITLPTDDVIFTSGSVYTAGTVTVSAGRLADSLTFSQNAATTLTGGDLTIGGGLTPGITLTAAMTNPVAINSAVAAGVSQTWTNNGSSSLTLGSTVNILASTLTLGGTGAGAIIFNGAISGTGGSVVVNGTAPVTLAVANGFTGGLFVNSGTVIAGNAGAAGLSTTAITLGNAAGGSATFLVNTGSNVPNPINLAASAVGTLTVGNNLTTGTATLSGAIALNGNNLQVLNTGTTGTTTLSGGITGTGNITVKDNASSVNGGVNFSSFAVNNTGTITQSGTGTGTLTFNADVGTNVTGIVQDTPGTMQFNQSTTFSYAGPINLEEGTLTFEYNMSVPGITSITMGPGTTLRTDLNSVPNAMGSGTLTINGGTFTRSGGTGNVIYAFTLSAVNINNDFTFAGTTGTTINGALTFSQSVNITGNNPSADFTGSMNQTGAGGYTITKSGTGSLVLSSNVAPGNFTGNYAVNQGVLDISGVDVTNASNVVSISSGAELLIYDVIRFGPVTATVAGLNDGAGSGIVAGGNASFPAITFAGSGTYSFSGSISGTTNVSATTPPIVSVTQSGSGMQILSGNNTFTGNVAVTGGTLRATSNTALGFGGVLKTFAGTGSINGTAAAATLDLAGGITVSKFFAMNGSTNGANLINSVANTTSVFDNGVATMLPTTAPTVTTNLPVGTTLTFTGGGGTGATGIVSLQATASTFVISGGSTVYSVAPTVTISGGGGSGATATAVLASGVVTGITLGNGGVGYTSLPTITFTGGTVTSAGTNPIGTVVDNTFTYDGLQMTAAGTGYTSAPAVTTSLGSGAFSSAITFLVLTGTNNNLGGAGNLTINAPISGAAGGFTKIGGGTVSLTAANTYTGGTTDSNGTLIVSNTSGSATGTGNVTMNGGTLGGAGIISGNVIAGTGLHTIAPSAGLSATSTTHLTVGGLTTSGNTTLAFNLNGAGVNDTITAGAVTLNGGNIVVANTATGLGSLGYYKLISYTGSILGTGVSSLALPTSPAGPNVVYTLDTVTNPGSIDLHRGFLGDANDDGVVNFADFIQLSNNFGSTVADWSDGDFNGDGIVNFADFIILSNNFGNTIPGTSESVSASDYAELAAGESALFGTSSVPEPTSLALMGLGAVALLKRRRKA